METPRVERSVQADEDLIAIWIYIADHNPVAADGVIDFIHAECRRIAENPSIGRNRDDLYPGIRSLAVGKSSWRSRYLVFYVESERGINIARILEGHRDISPDDLRTG